MSLLEIGSYSGRLGVSTARSNPRNTIVTIMEAEEATARLTQRLTAYAVENNMVFQTNVSASLISTIHSTTEVFDYVCFYGLLSLARELLPQELEETLGQVVGLGRTVWVYVPEEVPEEAGLSKDYFTFWSSKTKMLESAAATHGHIVDVSTVSLPYGANAKVYQIVHKSSLFRSPVLYGGDHYSLFGLLPPMQSRKASHSPATYYLFPTAVSQDDVLAAVKEERKREEKVKLVADASKAVEMAEDDFDPKVLKKAKSDLVTLMEKLELEKKQWPGQMQRDIQLQELCNTTVDGNITILCGNLSAAVSAMRAVSLSSSVVSVQTLLRLGKMGSAEQGKYEVHDDDEGMPRGEGGRRVAPTLKELQPPVHEGLIFGTFAPRSWRALLDALLQVTPVGKIKVKSEGKGEEGAEEEEARSKPHVLQLLSKLPRNVEEKLTKVDRPCDNIDLRVADMDLSGSDISLERISCFVQELTPLFSAQQRLHPSSSPSSSASSSSSSFFSSSSSSSPSTLSYTGSRSSSFMKDAGSSSLYQDPYSSKATKNVANLGRHLFAFGNLEEVELEKDDLLVVPKKDKSLADDFFTSKLREHDNDELSGDPILLDGIDKTQSKKASKGAFADAATGTGIASSSSTHSSLSSSASSSSSLPSTPARSTTTSSTLDPEAASAGSGKKSTRSSKSVDEHTSPAVETSLDMDKLVDAVLLRLQNESPSASQATLASSGASSSPSSSRSASTVNSGNGGLLELDDEVDVLLDEREIYGAANYEAVTRNVVYNAFEQPSPLLEWMRPGDRPSLNWPQRESAARQELRGFEHTWELVGADLAADFATGRVKKAVFLEYASGKGYLSMKLARQFPTSLVLSVEESSQLVAEHYTQMKTLGIENEYLCRNSFSSKLISNLYTTLDMLDYQIVPDIFEIYPTFSSVDEFSTFVGQLLSLSRTTYLHLPPLNQLCQVLEWLSEPSSGGKAHGEGGETCHLCDVLSMVGAAPLPKPISAAQASRMHEEEAILEAMMQHFAVSAGLKDVVVRVLKESPREEARRKQTEADQSTASLLYDEMCNESEKLEEDEQQQGIADAVGFHCHYDPVQHGGPGYRILRVDVVSVERDLSCPDTRQALSPAAANAGLYLRYLSGTETRGREGAAELTLVRRAKPTLAQEPGGDGASRLRSQAKGAMLSEGELPSNDLAISLATLRLLNVVNVQRKQLFNTLLQAGDYLPDDATVHPLWTFVCKDGGQIAILRVPEYLLTSLTRQVQGVEGAAGVQQQRVDAVRLPNAADLESFVPTTLHEMVDIPHSIKGIHLQSLFLYIMCR